MAESGEALPATTLAKIKARATAESVQFKNFSPAGQQINQKPENDLVQKQLLNKLQGLQESEELKNEQYIAKMTKVWSDADANGDGKLDLLEYRTFYAAMKDMYEADGEWYNNNLASI